MQAGAGGGASADAGEPWDDPGRLAQDVNRLLEALDEAMLPLQSVRRLLLRDHELLALAEGRSDPGAGDRSAFLKAFGRFLLSGGSTGALEGAGEDWGRDVDEMRWRVPWQALPEALQARAVRRGATVVERCEREGWVELDPRVVRYGLTPAGRTALQAGGMRPREAGPPRGAAPREPT